ncbi:hypothetical protein PUNSTDRAFT_44194 [Punctularia strigosozonata HHB-11173 SS5]|uniref:uncharacterized protein n=1 Tax=Punctularia strigosozonata (strain HHB-11173) TaxID=741275 RepID=UPI000441862B|nr:uncharacterized protein PUNSTDRAFT_44194 [Punctularia strigosozonata HHB-11173 SS5]EIN10000.1 hypothetical protein PUNSTDRAFT_44194 [Punctularia strigosozonata HHB-11173 SS5]
MFSPTSSPIDILPDDILHIIMEKLRKDPHARLATKGAPKQSWMVVTYVCRRWRRLALNTPTLWNHLDFRVVPLSKVDWFLLRSGEAPLSVFIPPGIAISDVASIVLVPNRHRIVKVFDMSNFSPLNPISPPSGLFEHEFPILEQLNMTWHHEGSHEEPPTLTATNIPRIRDLRLSGGPVECQGGKMPYLTNLSITLNEDTKSLEGLMCAIEGSPNLHALSLTAPGRARVQPTLVPVRKIGLHSLMEMYLNGYDWRFAVHMLDHLITPADCALFVSAQTSNHEIARQQALPTMLSRNRPWYRPIQDPRGTLKVRVERDAISVNPWARIGPRMPRSFFSLELTIPPWARDFAMGTEEHVGASALASIARLLSNAGPVEMLDVKLSTGKAANWRTFLEHFPDVVCLRCSRARTGYFGGLTETDLFGTRDDIFTAMCDALKTSPENPASLCPNLRHLTGFVDNSHIKTLIELVRSRTSLGSPLEAATVIGGKSFNAESEIMCELKGITRTEVVRDIGADSGLKMMAFSKEVPLVPETSADNHERCSNVSLSPDEVRVMLDKHIWG